MRWPSTWRAQQLRKTLLVVSEGLDDAPRRRGQEHLATIESVVRSANRANVSIYPIDPRPPSRGDGELESGAALQSLARDTDGPDWWPTPRRKLTSLTAADPRGRRRRERLLRADVSQRARRGRRVPSGAGARDARRRAGARPKRLLGAIGRRSAGARNCWRTPTVRRSWCRSSPPAAAAR